MLLALNSLKNLCSGRKIWIHMFASDIDPDEEGMKLELLMKPGF